MSSEHFCLKWTNFQTSMVQALEMLKCQEELVDVTLSCEGRSIRAHKIILSACSNYFSNIFKENPCQHPVVILKDVRWVDLESLVKYMYAGQVYVKQDQLGRFLKTAEALQVKGLARNPFISSHGGEDDLSEDSDVEVDDYQDQQHQHRDPQVVRVVGEQLTAPPPAITGRSTLPYLLSLPPLSVPHPTPPPSLSPSSLPSPGKGGYPIKVPSPPNSSFNLKRPSYGSLAHYLSGVTDLSQPDPQKRMKMMAKPTSTSLAPMLPPYSPPHSSSSGEGGRGEGEEDSEGEEGLVIEEEEQTRGQISSNSVQQHISHHNSIKLEVGDHGEKLNSLSNTNINSLPSPHSNKNKLKDVDAASFGSLAIPKTDNNQPQGPQDDSTATHPRNRWRCMQPRVCNYCWKTFSNSFNLKQHIVNVHVQSQGVACNVCNKVVKNKWYLRKHLVTAHGAPLKRSKNNNNHNSLDNHNNINNMDNLDQTDNSLETSSQVSAHSIFVAE